MAQNAALYEELHHTQYPLIRDKSNLICVLAQEAVMAQNAALYEELLR